jgi:nucleoside-triphosphatase THEP1/ABC-type thiamin/hydroxymethylpyrimidine transport system permease subunit
MKEPPIKGSHSLIYYRLIALWVLCEAMLGGIIHGLKIPVSGLVVGSCAIVCICLIAWYVPKKGAILKATIIVAIFKMMLSPQAPAPAYIAVFFQGLMGELLFWNRRFFRLACMMLAILGLLESGLQRILVLTLVYGNDLWKVINDFINGFTRQKSSTNYSLLIGAGYVVLHLITGLFIGWWASGLPARVISWRKEEGNKMIISHEGEVVLSAASKKKRRLKKGLFVIWIILVGLYIQSWFKIGTPLLPSYIPLKILLRSLIIVLSWYFIVSPLLKQILHSWLKKKLTRSQQEVQQVVQLLPATKNLVVQSWQRSAGKKGWKRISAWSKMVLVNALYPVTAKQIFILTGPKQTGKTTSLMSWLVGRSDVTGILTPVVNGLRFFMNAKTKEQFNMEAERGEAETLTVGRFIFSKNNFDKAAQIIREDMDTEGWLVIDEIGPMELKGEGFCEVLKEVLAGGNSGEKVLLVVREGMAENVKDYFQINDAVVINTISAL